MNQVEQDALELGWRVAALLSLEEEITIWIRPPFYFNGSQSDPKKVVPGVAIMDGG